MYTVIETPVYSNKVSRILTEGERDAFAAFISLNPTAGVVVRGSGGIRKARWNQRGRGKSGGVRIIYYNRIANGEIWLLTIFRKSERPTIPAHELRMIKETIENV